MYIEHTSHIHDTCKGPGQTTILRCVYTSVLGLIYILRDTFIIVPFTCESGVGVVF
jgi:hypothetical protein